MICFLLNFYQSDDDPKYFIFLCLSVLIAHDFEG